MCLEFSSVFSGQARSTFYVVKETWEKLGLEAGSIELGT